MSQTIHVNYEGKPCYNIEIRHNFDDLKEAVKSMNDKSYHKACIVTDSNVSPLYLENVMEALGDQFDLLTSFEFTAGEASKNLDTVQDLYELLVQEGFDRKDLLIALGGGVVGDLTGFAAATYMRGIDFIQVPTTLLSQVDSSVGGKTGVDFRSFKNMVGAFYMPQLVYMNVSTLLSLDNDQFACGMGEVVKHGFIRDYQYHHWLKSHQQEIISRDLEALEYMVTVSASIKRDVVEIDPKEQSIRAYLNFGHTIGHAVEKLSDFALFHGQCVAIGMSSALYLSEKLDYINHNDVIEAKDLMKAFGLPVNVPQAVADKMSPELVLTTTRSDKKKVGDKVKFIVLRSLGQADSYMDFTYEDFLEAIRLILSREDD